MKFLLMKIGEETGKLGEIQHFPAGQRHGCVRAGADGRGDDPGGAALCAPGASDAGDVPPGNGAVFLRTGEYAGGSGYVFTGHSVNDTLNKRKED